MSSLNEAKKNIPSREDLERKLSSNVLEVIFIKINGNVRRMRCTKRLDLIPKDALPKTLSAVHPTTVTVWDLTLKNWRSFRYDAVVKVTEVDK